MVDCEDSIYTAYIWSTGKVMFTQMLAGGRGSPFARQTTLHADPCANSGRPSSSRPPPGRHPSIQTPLQAHPVQADHLPCRPSSQQTPFHAGPPPGSPLQAQPLQSHHSTPLGRTTPFHPSGQIPPPPPPRSGRWYTSYCNTILLNVIKQTVYG